MRKLGRKARNPQAGMTLVELLISMFVLAVGLGALAQLFFVASATNTRNIRDTSSVMISKMFLEAAMSQHINSANPTFVTDCQGNVWSVGVADAAAPNGAGALLDNNPASITYGSINRLGQTYAAVPANYKAQYVDCNNLRYDVRWNSMTVTPGVARLITVSTQLQPNQNESLTFTIPVSLRGIGGP